MGGEITYGREGEAPAEPLRTIQPYAARLGGSLALPHTSSADESQRAPNKKGRLNEPPLFED